MATKALLNQSCEHEEEAARIAGAASSLAA
jgi:hypothetical protein